MNAEEIRNIKLHYNRDGDPFPGQVSEFQCAMVQEIAAQLAELNETCRKFQMSRPKFWTIPSPSDLTRYPKRNC